MQFSLDGESKAHRIYKLRALAHKFCSKDGEKEVVPTTEDPALISVPPTTQVFQCRGCSRTLFLENHLIEHEKGMGTAFSFCSSLLAECDAYYIEPMNWMIGINKTRGDIQCPSCFTVIGSWNWEPTKCSCFTSLTPSFKIDKSKVIAT